MFTVSRAEQAVTVVLGAVAALSPIWVAHSSRALWTLVVLGVLIALAGLSQLADRASGWTGRALGVLGVLMFISPWVMNFHSYSNASWVAWIVGALTVVVALAEMPEVSGRFGAAAH
ncbi:SPW repeat protein [Nocardia sp. CDC160]|uniref:SPW repeat protein n=1 Tax=Nocardia sp. CDC160 TaxID=3112166 RepID=UPI002DB733BC|nr:SPW repeat protein [Nocardia sp. CDC160]MEC3919467.1 SPW repeat protein [Nocardia sp. CDC160]